MSWILIQRFYRSLEEYKILFIYVIIYKIIIMYEQFFISTNFDFFQNKQYKNYSFNYFLYFLIIIIFITLKSNFTKEKV